MSLMVGEIDGETLGTMVLGITLGISDGFSLTTNEDTLLKVFDPS